jgi:signal transduction histidine kinase
VGSALGFTVGLAGFVACAPLVGHAALAYPHGRVASRSSRAALGIAYGGAVGLLGVLATTAFDPAREGCLECPRNLLLVRSDPGAFTAIVRWGLRLGIVWAAGLAALLLWRLVRSRSPHRGLVAVVAPAAAYLAAQAWYFEQSLALVVLGNSPFDRSLRQFQALALVAVAAGVAWGIYRSLRARSSVAQLVVDLRESSAETGARGALAEALDDPNLQLGFRRAGSDNYVDTQGEVIDLELAADRALTPLLRDGRPVAAVVHDTGLLRDPGLIEEVVSGARLAIEHERFRLEVGAQLDDLRASRVRIVEAGDAERRRLERDLHDGAQQRLVGLSLALRMLRLASVPAPALDRRMDKAEGELRAALAELRDLAHGIFPAALADDGLAAALETLAETSASAIEIHALTEARVDQAVEAAAYFVVSETLRRTRAPRAKLTVSRVGDRLVVELDSEGGVAEEPLIDLEDRVGAVGGTLEIARNDNRLRLRAELPCG